MKQTLVIFVMIFTALTSNACECFRMTFSEEIANSDKIFVGIVLTKQPVFEPHNSGVYYLFSVSQTLKGEIKDTITISSGFGGPDCGMIFEVGKTYIVFSNFNRTSSCARNSVVSQNADSSIFKSLFKPDFLSSIGKIANPILPDIEAEYLNFEFLRQRKDFEFKNKKIAFFIDDSLMEKQKILKDKKSKIRLTEIIVLTEEEKSKANNYDVIILTPGKIYGDKIKRNRFVKKLTGN